MRGVKLEPTAEQTVQVITIESWLKAGFEPVSVNLIDEIRHHSHLPDVLRHFRVETIPVTPQMRVRTSAPLCPLRDFLDAIYRHTNNAPIAIINADIRLAPSANQALADRVAEIKETEFLIGQRNDITYLADGSKHSNTHGHGIDFLAFHSSWIPRLAKCLSPTLAIGLPWWDHYLPLALSAYGAQTRLLDARWFEHDVHSFQWNWNHYCRVGRAAMTTFYRAMLPLNSSVTANCWLNALNNEMRHPAIPTSIAPLAQKLSLHNRAPILVAKSPLGRLAAANMRILLQSATDGPTPTLNPNQSPTTDASSKPNSTSQTKQSPFMQLEKFVRVVGDYQHAISNKRIPKNHRPKSVYFFTFHKCASTLFGSIVLKRVIGLNNVNYADQIYAGKAQASCPFTFQEKGCIYGPLRVTRKSENDPMEDLLIGPIIQPDFLSSKRAVFLIRDPRAILTSEYYSFGFSHSLSNQIEIRTRQETTRRNIQKMTVDEYTLSRCSKLIEAFQRLDFAYQHCQERILLRYEDLVDDFDTFIERFCSFVPLRQPTIDVMYRESRPKKSEDIQSHKRSGLPSGFRRKLLPETIEALNQQLAPILERYRYEL